MVEATKRNRLERREIPTLPSADRGLRSSTAWIVSLLFHTAVLVTIGSLWVSTSNGTGGSPDRPVGIAVIYEAEGREAYELSGGGSQSNEAATSAEDALPSANDARQTSSEIEALLGDLLPDGGAIAGELASASGSLGLGEGGGDLGGNRGIPKAKTSVFGIEGEGTRFLYVFDRSDSMNGFGGLPLQFAKTQLLESLQSLGPVHQFQIIFYNDSPLPYGSASARGPQMLKGDEISKGSAQRFVKDIVAVGGTQHIDALRMGISMGPDVIFFLTDADRPEPAARDIEDLQIRASRVGCTIHTIQFGAGANQTGGGWIKRLAQGTLGQYRYLDVAALDASEAKQ